MKMFVYLHFFSLNSLLLIVLTVNLAAQQTVSSRLTAETKIIPKPEKVYVIGAVVTAGTYSFDESDTVSKAIDNAGGLSANADGTRVEICHRAKANYKGNRLGKSFFVDLEAISK